MNDERKTKKQLLEELEQERERSLALSEHARITAYTAPWIFFAGS